MKTFLTAHDFDETSERALDEAIALARPLGAKVVVTHVYSVPVYTFPEGSALIPSAEEAARISEAAQQHLDATLARRRAAGVEVTGVLRSGAPEEEICKLADELGVDLVVVGTHSRGALGRALLGSVAERVIRNANKPVMTVRGPRPE